MAEDGIGDGDRILIDSGFAHLLDGAVDVVGDAAEFHAAIFDDGVGCAWIAIAGLSDAAGIHDLHAVKFEMHGNMSVADADEVGFKMFKPLVPEFGVWIKVFVHGIARGGVDHEEAEPIEFDAVHDGHAGEPGEVFVVENFEVSGSQGCGESSKGSCGLYGYSLSH